MEKARLGVQAVVEKARLAELVMLALERFEADLREVVAELNEDAPAPNVDESAFMLNDLDKLSQTYREACLAELLDKASTVKNTATDVSATLAELEVFLKRFSALTIEVRSLIPYKQIFSLSPLWCKRMFGCAASKLDPRSGHMAHLGLEAHRLRAYPSEPGVLHRSARVPRRALRQNIDHLLEGIPHPTRQSHAPPAPLHALALLCCVQPLLTNNEAKDLTAAAESGGPGPERTWRIPAMLRVRMFLAPERFAISAFDNLDPDSSVRVFAECVRCSIIVPVCCPDHAYISCL